jgi:Glucodextranase, domain N
VAPSGRACRAEVGPDPELAALPEPAGLRITGDERHSVTAGPDGVVVRALSEADPALGNSSRHDTGTRAGDALLAADGGIASALVSSLPFTRTSSGFVGTSDGWTDLQDRSLDWSYDTAPDGNVLQTGEVPVSGTTTFTLALGFGGTTGAAESAARGSSPPASRTAPRPPRAATTPPCPARHWRCAAGRAR